jgi:hypothetical protein
MSLAETIVSECFSKGVILYLNDSGKLSAFGQLPPDWVTLVAGWVEHRDLVAEYLKEPTEQHARNVRSVLIAQAKFRLNLPCIHLGALVEKHPACGCGPRHECTKHGFCVISGATNRWAVCSRCSDFEATT